MALVPKGKVTVLVHSIFVQNISIMFQVDSLVSG